LKRYEEIIMYQEAFIEAMYAVADELRYWIVSRPSPEDEV